MKILDVVKEQIERRYGKSLEEVETAIAKSGMECVGVGRAENGAHYLTVCGMVPDVILTRVDDVILLRPKPRRRILLEETGEVRPGRKGEYGSHENTSNEPICLLYETLADVRIWKARELAPGEEGK